MSGETHTATYASCRCVASPASIPEAGQFNPTHQTYLQLGRYYGHHKDSKIFHSAVKSSSKKSLTCSTGTVSAGYEKTDGYSVVFVAHMENLMAQWTTLHAAWYHTTPESTSSHRDQTHRAKRVEDAVARETKHLKTQKRKAYNAQRAADVKATT